MCGGVSAQAVSTQLPVMVFLCRLFAANFIKVLGNSQHGTTNRKVLCRSLGRCIALHEFRQGVVGLQEFGNQFRSVFLSVRVRLPQTESRSG